jgi:hypothetical protein
VLEGLNKWYKLINQFVVSSGSKILNEKNNISRRGIK